jgi:PAS domain S-box-containing protein
MRYVLSYLHVFSAILFLGLGAVIIVKDFKARLNQACAAIMFCFFIWSFSTIWVHHPATPESLARSFGHVATIGWLFYNPFHLWFAWLYTKRKPFRFIVPVTAALFILPLVLLLLQWTRHILIVSFVHCSWGWFTPWESSLWSMFFFVYCGSVNLLAFWLIFDYGRRSDNRIIRRQSIVIIVTGLISLASGFISNVILSFFITGGVPPLGDVLSLLWAAGLAYVAIRYNVLNITPFIAANRIIATMKDLLFLLDTHGNVMSVNGAVRSALGYQIDQIASLSFSKLISESTDKRENILQALLQQPVYMVETVLVGSSGGTVPVTLSTSLIAGTGVVCVAHDISLQKQRTESLKEAKKQLESRVLEATDELRTINSRLRQEIQEKNQAVDALKESEERFRIIFEHAPDGIFLVDADGRFVDGNNEALRIIGREKDTMAGKAVFVSGQHSGGGAPAFTEMVSGQTHTAASDYRETTLPRADGSVVPVETGFHQLMIGTKRLYVCIMRDLSQRKKAEKEAQELREALHHSQKMDAVGRLAGGIAHDFNNLLGGIIGYAGLLQKRLQGGFPAELAVLDKIIDVSKKAAERTAQLLAFARKGKYNVEPVNMHDLITDVISLMKHTFDPKIVLSCCLDASGAIVKGDRSQLHSALLNLGINARDALPDGGVIEFSTENVRDTEVRSVDGFIGDTADSYMKIIVKDNGIGMDETTASRVFEPFFSTKEEGKGTGLGLPSVYGTIKQHGGSIDLRTTAGAGSEFVIHLPVCAEAIAPERVSESQSVATEQYQGTVLVVDDTPLVREMMTDALEDVGFSVHSSDDGKSALQWFREHHASCDLVILDFTMPDMNGRECYSAMKMIHPDVRAIIASGHAVDGEIEKTLEIGATSFLHKPFDIDTLITTVQDVLSKA